MADSAVPVSGGSGYNVDTRTESINGDHRQVVVLGDPVTGANVVTVDANGRLNTSTGGSSISTPAAVSAATSSNTYTITAGLAGNVTFWVYCNSTSGGVSSGVIVFEQSPDGTNWAPLPVVRSDTGAAITTLTATTLAANSGIAFDAAMEGVQSARMRVTTASGANVLMYGLAGGLAFEPSVAITGSPTVTAPAITKGTQGGTGFTVQDLKDAGRSLVTYSATATAGVTTEALIATATTTRGGTNVGTAGSVSLLTVTSGKTLRINNISASVRQSSATATTAWSRLSLRYVTSGSATASSPIGWAVELSPASAQNSVDRFSADFPDGIELPGGGSYAISHVTSATTNLHTVTVTGYEY